MFTRQVAPGIMLRQIQMNDANPLFELVERDRAYLRQWLPWVDYTETVDDVHRFIQRTHNQFEANLGPNAAIVIEGRVAGTIGCHPIDWSNRHCSIGYWIAA